MILWPVDYWLQGSMCTVSEGIREAWSERWGQSDQCTPGWGTEWYWRNEESSKRRWADDVTQQEAQQGHAIITAETQTSALFPCIQGLSAAAVSPIFLIWSFFHFLLQLREGMTLTCLIQATVVAAVHDSSHQTLLHTFNDHFLPDLAYFC